MQQNRDFEIVGSAAAAIASLPKEQNVYSVWQKSKSCRPQEEKTRVDGQTWYPQSALAHGKQLQDSFTFEQEKFETFQIISASKGWKVWKSKNFDYIRILKI